MAKQEQWVEQKIDAAIAQMEAEIDLNVEVKAWIINQIQPFRVESCFKELQLSTPQQFTDCRKVVKDIMEQGIIEPSKVGLFRVIDRSVKYLEPKEEHPIDLSWPLGIESLTQICPHDVAIVAGVTGAGKTAFALNLAEKNMDKMPIRYIASEITGGDLYRKLRYMPKLKAEVNKKVEFIQRLRDQWDLILPDALNILDYMEIHKDFAEVGEWILKCFERLNKGVAVICMQKNPDAETARGGFGTMQKASLVINLEKNVAMIKKARWWTDPTYDPRSRCIDYTMQHGVLMQNTTPWR